MARISRAVAPGIPYHVTHRGNHRADVFFSLEDRDVYLRLLAEFAKKFGMDVWAYCLMTNHIHLIVVPRERDSLARAVGFAHMRYSRRVNQREGWTGHLWANRFYSTALDGEHLWEAVRYVERNPVRAGLAERAEDWPWSSAAAHALGEANPLLSPTRPFPGGVEDWGRWLEMPGDVGAVERIRRQTCTGRPCGTESFVEQLEGLVGRILRPLKRGRKPKGEAGGDPAAALGGDLFGEPVE
ncbi:MAG: transposase [Candidatus Sumerlaeaceae bacterium]|nr:transposase [Candidatus Sumerlaeaceae bacterium]